MALPHQQITKIPDNEPDAVPSLWNVRYEEIDENFENLDSRVENIEGEITTARGENPTLNGRLNNIEVNLQGLNPDAQNMVVATIKKALDSAGLANREIQKTLKVRIQQGEIFIPNRGVINGLAVSKSSNATRNLNVSAGRFFMFGQQWSIKEMNNTASVGSNPTDITQVCYVYLHIDGSTVKIDCSEFGANVPDDGLILAQLSIPPNNTEATDPYLNNITITDMRRIEPTWPNILQSPAYAIVPLKYPFLSSDYAIRLEIAEYAGPKPSIDEIIVESKAGNGFTLVAGCMADSLKINYLVVQNTI